MISIIYPTCRDRYAFTDHPDWDHFEVFARSCDAQTYRDFEVVVVTPFIDSARRHARPNWLIVEPMDSPWRRARTFAVSSAVNTGLIHARGDWCAITCDAAALAGNYVERIAEHAERGIATAIMSRDETGAWADPRQPWQASHADADGCARLRLDTDDPLPQGLTAFPTEVALAMGGFDCHFEGARGLDDMDFGHRLLQAGVPLVLDGKLSLTCYAHEHCDPEIIAEESVRCCNPTWHIARERDLVRVNAIPYTPEEQQRVLDCYLWRDGKCGHYGHRHPCAYAWGEHGHPIARRIMLEEGEVLVDLERERRRL